MLVLQLSIMRIAVLRYSYPQTLRDGKFIDVLIDRYLFTKWANTGFLL